MDINNEQIVKWLKLTFVKNGLGPIRIQKLLNLFGNIDKIYDVSSSELLATGIMNKKMIDSFEKLKNASDSNLYKLIETCESNNIKILPFFSSFYPKKLKSISQSPLTLYLKGNEDLLNSKQIIAVVGVREPSKEARDMAYSFSKSLSNSGVVIISGGALGIDTAAHLGALESDNKRTISVLPYGFLHPYPSENKELFDSIVENGGLLVSENSPNFKGSEISFVQRNRITSGLSDSIFVVAANEAGGGWQQMKTAHMQKKPIFCPKLNKNILPNEGIKVAIKDFDAVEIDSADTILNKTRNHSNMLQKYIQN